MENTKHYPLRKMETNDGYMTFNFLFLFFVYFIYNMTHLT